MPTEALREAGEGGEGERVRVSRQLNVRLTSYRYGVLSSAAELCGVTPTTLARMLLYRGALAIVEEHNQDRVRFATPE